MNYAKDLEIDQDYLDEEWGKQPSLYMQYGEALAKAEQYRDELKQELDVLKARIENGVMTGQIKLEKTTGSAVSAYVQANEEVVQKGRELVKAQHDCAILKAAVEAFQHRKKALEKLTDLFVFGYNAEPKAGRVDRIRQMKRDRVQGSLIPDNQTEEVDNDETGN